MTAPQRLPRMASMKSFCAAAGRLLIGVLLASGAMPALPEAPSLYTVEIVVFRGGGDAGALPDTAPPPTVTDDDVEVTPVPTTRLGAAAAKLRGRNSGFRVLAHTAWTQAPTAWNSRRGASSAQLELAAGITGKVFLYRGDVLSLGLDLTVEDGGRRFHISQVHRNVKTSEIYYFDHPSVGVLAVVSAAPAPAPG